MMEWSLRPAVWVGAWLVAALAAYVALALARFPERSSAWRLHGCAGLAQSTGACAAHFLAMSSEAASFSLPYDGLALMGIWLSSTVLAFAGFAAAARPDLRLVGAPLLVVPVAAVPLLCMTALQVNPDVLWRWSVAQSGWLGLLALVAGGAFAWSRADRGSLWVNTAWHVAGASAIATATMAANVLTVHAAGLSWEASAVPTAWSLTGESLFALSALGAPALLAVLLATSVLVARFRAALQRAREELEAAAQTDSLTGLPNRAMFERSLARLAVQADRTEERLALMFINLDGLTTVNESIGQAAGDAVLREMGRRLRAVSGARGLVARAGGDEFLLLMDGHPAMADAKARAERMLKVLCEPCTVEEREVTVSCSVGIALYPEHGAQAKLIPHAAAAMNAAKRNGGATYCVFEARMVEGVRDQAELLRDLRRAIQRKELELYYQPKIHAPSGQVTGVEALMRWHHPERGMVGPNIFIPLAERFGLIQPLGNWLIEDVCAQIRQWRDGGLRMRVAINLSVHQLRQDDLVDRISGALARQGIEPGLLTCEITESAAMEDTRTTLRTIERLSAAGVHLSIDDFGTGYSSLSYLRQLAAEELKIDRSFVLDLETSADARAIVDAVVKLAQALGLKVVAEGVETEEQRAILRTLGCDELQGYLFARPMSARALGLWAMKDTGARSADFRPSLFDDPLAKATA